jgi:hypothetical protein
MTHDKWNALAEGRVSEMFKLAAHTATLWVASK